MSGWCWRTSPTSSRWSPPAPDGTDLRVEAQVPHQHRGRDGLRRQRRVRPRGRWVASHRRAGAGRPERDDDPRRRRPPLPQRGRDPRGHARRRRDAGQPDQRLRHPVRRQPLAPRRDWATFGPVPTGSEVGEVLDQLVVAPDGITAGSEGAIWAADTINGRVVRAREGVVDEVAAGTGCFACVLGGRRRPHAVPVHRAELRRARAARHPTHRRSGRGPRPDPQ